MKLRCPKNPEHKQFRIEECYVDAYDAWVADEGDTEYGDYLGRRHLVREYFCRVCNEPALRDYSCICDSFDPLNPVFGQKVVLLEKVQRYYDLDENGKTEGSVGKEKRGGNNLLICPKCNAGVGDSSDLDTNGIHMWS